MNPFASLAASRKFLVTLAVCLVGAGFVFAGKLDVRTFQALATAIAAVLVGAIAHEDANKSSSSPATSSPSSSSSSSPATTTAALALGCFAVVSAIAYVAGCSPAANARAGRAARTAVSIAGVACRELDAPDAGAPAWLDVACAVEGIAAPIVVRVAAPASADGGAP